MQILAGQLQQLSDRCFNDRLADFIYATYPVLSARIRRHELFAAFERIAPVANSYALTEEVAVGTFIHLSWLFGEGFDFRIPILSQVLTDPTLPPVLKVEALDNFAVAVFAGMDAQGHGLPA